MSETQSKINLLLKAAGDAPIMKQNNWTVEGDHTIAWLVAFIKKYLNIDVDSSLFLFMNQSFSPSPDHTLSSLHQCFTTSDKLVIHYSTTNAWG
uniref:Ubiquitin-like protein ATG12 n=1 Tax=Acrobeloides nanus TaxID=290746 RepID=A0A914E925_9BILA